MADNQWRIEMQGPAWLTVRHSGGYEFCWTENENDSLRFDSRHHADLVMMAVRQLRGDLFPSCLTKVPCATEYFWKQGEGWKRVLPA